LPLPSSPPRYDPEDDSAWSTLWRDGHFAALAETIPHIVWTSTADGQHKYLNRRWYEYTGAAAGSVNWTEYLHPEDRTEVVALWSSRAPADAFSAEFRIRRHDGAFRWMLMRAQPLRQSGGGIERWVGTLTDIHDSKTEANANADLAALVHSSPDAIISCTRDGIIRSWNHGAERIFGFAAAEVIGQTIGRFAPQTVPPPGMPTAQERLLAGETIRREVNRQHRDGTQIQIAWTAAPTRAADGTIVGILLIGRDISERRREEQARELANRELRHRIKNIFAVVTSLISLSARREPEAKGFADRLNKRLTALGTAQEYIRPLEADSGAQTLQGLLQKLMLPYRSETQERVQVTGDDCPIGLSSATALAMVVHELATNALKYGSLSASHGQVRITTTTCSPELLLSWTESGGPVVQPSTRKGFGTEMIERNVSAQLGGTVAMSWTETGLAVELRIPKQALSK
jgi:PAS domain S-box-containing protein